MQKFTLSLLKEDKDYYRGDDETTFQKARKSFEQALNPIKLIADKTLANIRKFNDVPEEVTMTMGVKFSGEANVILSKIAGEANFELTIKWSKDAIQKTSDRADS